MPVKISGSFNPEENILDATKEKLSTFLTEEELSKTEIIFTDGKLSFKSNEEILNKIKLHLGKPL